MNQRAGYFIIFLCVLFGAASSVYVFGSPFTASQSKNQDTAVGIEATPTTTGGEVLASPTVSASPVASPEQSVVTSSALASATGLNGQRCYVAVSGKVYDATGSREWRNGVHTQSGGRAQCGADLTNIMKESPHSASIVNELTYVGALQ